MDRIALFLDDAKLNQAFRKLGTRIDYLGLRDYLAEGRLLVEAFVYLPINPYNPERTSKFSNFLRHNRFNVRSKVGKPRPNNKFKCNFEAEMAVDVLHFTLHGRVDTIVIGSGNGDLLPVCEEVRRYGVRCEIAATKECTAQEMFNVANGYIDLGTIIREQREEIIEDGSEEANGNVPELAEP